MQETFINDNLDHCFCVGDNNYAHKNKVVFEIEEHNVMYK